MAKSPQIQSRISAIAKELANGKKRADIMPKYAKKWGISQTSVDRYITNAKKEAQKLQTKASKVADDIYIAAKTQAAIEAVMSKQERLELLTRIAKGEFENETKKPAWNNAKKVFEIVTVKEKPDHNGVIKAIAEMNKMEGDYEKDNEQKKPIISLSDLNITFK